LNFHFFSE